MLRGIGHFYARLAPGMGYRQARNILQDIAEMLGGAWPFDLSSEMVPFISNRGMGC